MNKDTVTLTEFARHLRNTLNFVHYGNRPVLVTRHGKPFVKIMPPDNEAGPKDEGA